MDNTDVLHIVFGVVLLCIALIASGGAIRLLRWYLTYQDRRAWVDFRAQCIAAEALAIRTRRAQLSNREDVQ